MKRAITSLIVLTIFCGCASKEKAMTGFLSDYSKLKKESGSTLRYVDENAVEKYSGFIVPPVEVRFHSGSKSEGKLTDEQLTKLTDYMHTKIVEAIKQANRKVVSKPAPGVARVRVALSDLKKTSAINILPQASLLGAGIGGASMEAEVVDSVTGKQIGAVVQSGSGSRIPFTNLGDWTASKKVIDDWAKHFKERLIEANKTK